MAHGETIPFLAELRVWHENYVAQSGRRDVEVELQERSKEGPKRAAWIVARGRHAEGQLTLWESGECETEAVGTSSTGEIVPILLRSRVLQDRDLVMRVADDLVDHVADYSGT